jgi:hypothetical protein
MGHILNFGQFESFVYKQITELYSYEEFKITSSISQKVIYHLNTLKKLAYFNEDRTALFCENGILCFCDKLEKYTLMEHSPNVHCTRKFTENFHFEFSMLENLQKNENFQKFYSFWLKIFKEDVEDLTSFQRSLYDLIFKKSGETQVHVYCLPSYQKLIREIIESLLGIQNIFELNSTKLDLKRIPRYKNILVTTELQPKVIKTLISWAKNRNNNWDGNIIFFYQTPALHFSNREMLSYKHLVKFPLKMDANAEIRKWETNLKENSFFEILIYWILSNPRKPKLEQVGEVVELFSESLISDSNIVEMFINELLYSTSPLAVDSKPEFFCQSSKLKKICMGYVQIKSNKLDKAWYLTWSETEQLLFSILKNNNIQIWKKRSSGFIKILGISFSDAGGQNRKILIQSKLGN